MIIYFLNQQKKMRKNAINQQFKYVCDDYE